ncbi:RNA polymerase sigma factor [Streptomyces sp. NPDC020192]|uniref:RNA polymerase sigma factor n=1 Tax=Streptomyces sp. NPDC020192 TaxID=3365066 RepID=UPI0037930322
MKSLRTRPWMGLRMNDSWSPMPPREGDDCNAGWRGPPGFEEFFRHYAPMVRRFLIWREAESSILDDTVQMTMMSAYRYWERVRTMDPPTGWLFKVAGQRLHDARQALHRERLSVDADLADSHLVHPDPTPLCDQRMDILTAVHKLPPRQQEALALRTQFGLPYKDIAEIMGIAPATVRAHVHQAHETLRAILGQEGGGT